jgi:3-oxoacyl-[acyl-carrier-protein] synthase III
MAQPGLSCFIALDERDAPDVFRRVTNAELPFEQMERNGVHSRLIVHPGHTVTSVSILTLQKLFAVLRNRRRKIAPEDLSGFVLSSFMREDIQRHAEQTASALGIRGEIAGIDGACAGFVLAVDRAQEICKKTGKPVVVGTVELVSEFVNWEKPEGNESDELRARSKAAKIFGDGAAAVLLEPENQHAHEILDTRWKPIDDPRNLIQMRSVAAPAAPDGKERPGEHLCIDFPGRNGARLIPVAAEAMMEAVNWNIQEAVKSGLLEPQQGVDVVVPHQAGRRVIVVMQKIHHDVRACLEQWGNTSSASIPIAMSELQDTLPRGAIVAMPAVGAGSPLCAPQKLTVGSVLVRMGQR